MSHGGRECGWALSLALCAVCCARSTVAPPGSDDAGLVVGTMPAGAADAGQTEGSNASPMSDAATGQGGPIGSADAAMTPPAPASPECDLTGKWAVAQFTDSIADVLGVQAKQRAVNYLYFEIEQHGTSFVVTKSLRCGLKVTGATTVTISDATLNAVLSRDNSDGRLGRYAPNAQGGCDFSLEEVVNVWGCSTPYYKINRNEPLPTEPASGTNPGTEDWDQDNYAGITLSSGGGPRYVAMRDWNSYEGTTGQFVKDRFQVKVRWDSQEQVLAPTNVIVRAPSHRDEQGDHHAVWKRVDASKQIPAMTGLETCKNVQAFLADVQ